MQREPSVRLSNDLEFRQYCLIPNTPPAVIASEGGGCGTVPSPELGGWNESEQRTNGQWTRVNESLVHRERERVNERG